MANNDSPTLDGIAPSFTDISVTTKNYSGSPLFTAKDIKAINTSSQISRGAQIGPGGRKQRTTTGQLANEVSITFYRAGYQRFLRNLTEAAPERDGRKVLGLVFFDIDIQHSVPNDVEIYQRKILGCCCNGDTLNSQEGTDPDEVEVTFDVKEIVNMIDGVETSWL